MKRFVAGVALVTLGCLIYVFAEVQTFKIGYAIRRQEETKTLLLDRARALKYNIARMKSPANLEKRLQAHKVTLASPKTWQTIVMTGTAAPVRQPAMARSLWASPSILSKLFMGTAEAQAKESSS